MHGYHVNFVAIFTRIKSIGKLLFQQQLYRYQSTDWHCKSIERFSQTCYDWKETSQKTLVEQI